MRKPRTRSSPVRVQHPVGQPISVKGSLHHEAVEGGCGFFGKGFGACVDDEEDGKVLLQGELVSGVGTKDRKGGGVGIGESTLLVDNTHGRQLVRDGAARARIDVVRDAHAVFFVVVAVVAGRGDSNILKLYDKLDDLAGRDGLLDADVPRQTARVEAARLDRLLPRSYSWHSRVHRGRPQSCLPCSLARWR